MRKSISGPTTPSPTPAPRSAITSASTIPGGPIRALTGRRQTKPTSPGSRTTRQPKQDRRSTYQTRNAVQTNRATSNVQKRYLIHVAGYNLGLIMRLLTGAGTPREFQRQAFAWFFAIPEPDGGLIAMILVVTDNQAAAGAIYITTVDPA